MAEFLNPRNLNNLWERITSGHAFTATAIVIVLLFLVRAMILGIARRSIEDKFVRLRYRRGVSYFVFFAGIFLLLPVWLPSIRNIATFLGIFGAGFLVVTRELWLCIGGWAYLVIRRPYVIGDRIQIGQIAGDVIDIRLMETSIMEISSAEGGLTTGRIIYFPNAKIFTETIAATSKQIAHTFQEIHVRLDAAADWEAAGALLTGIANEHYATALAVKEQQDSGGDDRDVMSGYREPRVLTEMQGGHIILHLQFMAPTGQAANMTDRIWRSFLTAAKENPNIKFIKTPAP
jgi:small-conductance mechanosensitive channel